MNKLRKIVTTLASASLLLTLAFGVQAAAPSVTLENARTALEKASSIVVDIREPYEHAAGVAKGAKLIPMSQLGKRLRELPKPGAEPILIICNTQNRSSKIVEQLQAAGYTNASYVNGGMSQWASRGWPMAKP